MISEPVMARGVRKCFGCMAVALLGLVLVICILFLFLNRHVAWWSAVGIPVSIAGTFMLLYGTGGTINFLSVFAFLMALGIIVDDAIVVGEETVTQMEKGKPLITQRRLQCLDSGDSARHDAIRLTYQATNIFFML